MDELAELRFQLEAMKRELASSHIVNDRLLRTVMRQRSSWLNRLFNFEIATLPFFILIIVASTFIFGISIWYSVIFTIFAIADTIVDYKTVRFSPQDFYNLDLLSLRNKLIRQKRYRKLQYLISAPAALIWLICYSYAIFIHSSKDNIENTGHLVTLFVIIGVIAVIALIVIIYSYRKMQSTNEELIDQLDSK